MCWNRRPAVETLLKTVLCFGDSNTWGFVPAGDGKRFPWEIRWPGVLQGALGDSYRVIEEGLSGRTTVLNDPFVPHRNGLNYLIPCLESHKPLAWVVIFLGANDLCDRYAMTAADIARGAATLAAATLKSESGRDGRAPHVLVLGLPRLGPALPETMGRAAPKAAELSRCFSAAAEEAAVPLVDLAQVTAFSSLDGIHLDAEGHSVVAAAVGSAISSWPIATTQRTASSTA